LIKPPTQAEIDALNAFSHRWLVQAHKDSGRALEAVIAMHYPGAFFAAWDQKINAAFLLGYVLASAQAGQNGEKNSPTAPD
jgi:hypothetical protein